MPKLVNAVPKYRKHKQSGQAIVTLNGRDHLLGPHGTKASKREYDRLVAEWLARDRQPLFYADSDLSVEELAARYWAMATKRHVHNGKPTPEQYRIKGALSHLLKIYEGRPVIEFGPRELKVVRQSMVECGWARGYVNSETAVLVRMFKWAAVEGLVPAAVYSALELVDGFRRGQSEARETPKRHGVDPAIVETTLREMGPVVADMVRLQMATGARPGEICILRPMDVDRSGEIWEYRLAEHKTAHHGHDRLICVGPRGQDVLRKYLLRAEDAYCFSPREAETVRRTELSERRTTPLSCGNKPGSNVKRSPKRTAGDHYTPDSYRRAIHRACDAAFPPPEDVAADAEALATWQARHRWSPHQLRHAAATRIRREFDIEAAKAVLGHSSTNTTGIYAEVDRQRAVQVARAIG